MSFPWDQAHLIMSYYKDRERPGDRDRLAFSPSFEVFFRGYDAFAFLSLDFWIPFVCD